MKRELIAGVLMITLIALCALNIAHVDRLTAAMLDEIQLSREACERGDRESARGHFELALENWLSADAYTHIFIRHSEIDTLTDAFYDLLSSVENGDECSGAYEKLIYHLESIASMERISLGSIM